MNLFYRTVLQAGLASLCCSATLPAFVTHAQDATPMPWRRNWKVTTLAATDELAAFSHARQRLDIDLSRAARALVDRPL